MRLIKNLGKILLVGAIFSPMNVFANNMKMVVIRNGLETIPVVTNKNTVNEVLEENNIKINKQDIIKPYKEALVFPNQEIVVSKVVHKNIYEEESIPFETITKNNPEMFEGTSKVIQEGFVGKKQNFYSTTFINGEIFQKTLTSSNVLMNPTNKIVEVGTKKKVNTTVIDSANKVILHKSGRNLKYKKKITMQATAYDPTAGSKTAMGTKARVGAVAVDKRVIPLGSKLYVEGLGDYPSYGLCTAEDTGGAIKGNRIDLFYNSNAEALKFGRRNVNVYILE